MSTLAPVGIPERSPVLVYGRDELLGACAVIPQLRIVDLGDRPSVPRLRMRFSPGIVQLERTRDQRHFGRKSQVVDYSASVRVVHDNRDMDARANKAQITGWTPASRRMMQKRFSTLDYRPMFEGDRRPALVTLTMPGRRWDEVTPDGKTFKKLMERFLRRYAYAWKHELAGVWKMEFQRRGAPHLHMLIAPPVGRTPGTGQSFGEWLAGTWADLCKLPGWNGSNEEHVEIYRQHFLNGTDISYEKGLRGWDAITVAQYFSKHGTFTAKEYQNEPPDLWLEAGSVGRFWGYWRLDNGEVIVNLPDEDSDDTGGGAAPEKPIQATEGEHTPALSATCRSGEAG